jgi:cell wall-associated NlpC family hydrolase
MITPQQIVTEAQSWNGTPFAGHVRVKGVGCDCVGMVSGVMIALGVISRDTSFPRYTLGSGSHREASLVSEWITQTGLFTLEQSAQPGDVIGLQLGRVIHHVGIVVSDVSFIHAVEGQGVIESRMDGKPWENRIKMIWRLK